MGQGTKGFGNSCRAKNIFLSRKKSVEILWFTDKTYVSLKPPKNYVFKSAFLWVCRDLALGTRFRNISMIFDFWIWGVISKLEHFWHLTYYSQSWSQKSGLCENCIPTSSSFRLPYALLALAKIGIVSETEFHGPNSWRWLRWKRRGWWRDSKSRWWKKLIDATRQLHWVGSFWQSCHL